MKYTAIAFTLFSAVAAAASTTSSGTADDRDAMIRNLMNKVDILSAKVEAQDAELQTWRTELTSSLKHVKAAVAPQDKTSVRRNLRLEDEAAVEPLHYDSVLGEILYEVIAKVEKIKEAVEDVHECLDYDHTSSTCTLGDRSSINSVAIRGGTIHLESTSSGIGLTSTTRIDLKADTNVEITADRDGTDTIQGFAYIGTNNNGQISSDAGFRAFGSGSSASAKIYGQSRTDIDTGGTRVEVTCPTQTTTDKNLCTL